MDNVSYRRCCKIMIRTDDSIFFTDQDKRNLHVKKYTTEELINNEKIFRNKRKKILVANDPTSS